MESIYASEPTADDKPVMESGMESAVDDNATTPKHLVNVVAMANGLCDTERTPTGKGRRSQSRTCCRNRQSRQTNRYLTHDDVHCSEHPSLSESNSTVPGGLQPCGTVARREPQAKGPDGAGPLCNRPFDDIDAAACGAAPASSEADVTVTLQSQTSSFTLQSQTLSLFFDVMRAFDVAHLKSQSF
jgi:hypothetical protein